MLCGPEEEVPEGAEPRTSSIGRGSAVQKAAERPGQRHRGEMGPGLARSLACK